MLKQTVEYTDFDDNAAMETLYFNLTKTELTDNLHLQTRLEEIQEFVKGEKRDLATDEIRKILDLVKTFMRLSYGVRSEDGKRFQKTPQMWEEFSQTAVYDAFLFGLFEDPRKALEFMAGILPKDMRDQVRRETEAEMKKVGLEFDDISSPKRLVSSDNNAAEPKTPTVVRTTAPAVTTTVDLPAEESNTPPMSPADIEQFQAWQRANGQNGASQ